jgi:hypothetical protein
MIAGARRSQLLAADSHDLIRVQGARENNLKGRGRIRLAGRAR